MIGWLLARECLDAWRFGEESQHPTFPQLRQTRRCTQLAPTARHSSQPSTRSGLATAIVSRCVQIAIRSPLSAGALGGARVECAGGPPSARLGFPSPLDIGKAVKLAPRDATRA